MGETETVEPRRRRPWLGVLVVASVVTIALAGVALRERGDQGSVAGSGADGRGLIRQIAVEDRPQVSDFVAERLDGKRFALSELSGRVAVFNLWGSWCAPCRQEAPALRAVARQYRSKGVAFVGLNIRDNDASAQAFERKFAIPYPSIRSADSGRVTLAFDGQLTPNAVPTTVVVDQRGRVAARVLGATSAPTLRALLNDVLAEPGP